MQDAHDAQTPQVSVVITTHNRCALLAQTLECVLHQATCVAYEVIVVDNNSSDQTPQVVAKYAAAQGVPIRYLFEPRQGVSHGRNAGIGRARAGLIAFVDDDCCAASNWLTTMKEVFDDRPDIDCVGGKVLPHWVTRPPAWLDRRHWSPVALTDHGGCVLRVNARTPVCLIAANLGVRREVFDRVGLFSPDFSRSEDHEWELRFYSAGGQAMYVPGLVTTTEVPAVRCTKAYHRHWHAGHGRDGAAMRLNERIGRHGELIPVVVSPLALYGIPPFIYRELAAAACAWCRALMGGCESVTFEQENRLTYVAHYSRHRYRCWRAMPGASHVAELTTFMGWHANFMGRLASRLIDKFAPTAKSPAEARSAEVCAGTPEGDER